MNQTQALFTQGAIGPLLIRKSLHMYVGILGMLVFNLTDVFFISRLGTLELAAIGFTFPVVMAVQALAAGLSTGASTLISQAFGQQDLPLVRRLTTDSLILAFAIVLVAALAALASMDILFAALGAGPQHLPLIREYMSIWFLGMPFLVVPMLGNAAIRAQGEMKIPSQIMLIAMAINLALDPLLIFGWGPITGLGMAGAAWASLIARAFSLWLSLYVLHSKMQMTSLTWPGLTAWWKSSKEILHIALPSGATNLILPLGLGVATALVARFGEHAVAAFGVAGRVEMLAMGLMMALSFTLAPFFGQNWGAKNFQRLDEGLKRSYQFALVYGLLLTLGFWALGPWVAQVFTSQGEVAEVLVSYLWIVPLGYGFQGILNLSVSPLNVLNQPLRANACNLIYVFGFFIPLIYGGASWLGLPGLLWAVTLAKLLGGLTGAGMLHFSYAQARAALN